MKIRLKAFYRRFIMQYKGNRVFTSKDMMSILGAKSRATVRSFCKRHGIVPMKLSQRECVSLCDENGFRKRYPKGVLLFSVTDMDKALAVQGIGRNLAQANPAGNVLSFSNGEFQQLRVIEDTNGNPWFVGKDVAENLGYEYMKDAIRDNVYDEDKALLKRKNGKGIVILNENGSKGESRSLLENHDINENDSKMDKSSTLENPFPSPINITGLNVPPRGLTIINESGMYSLIFGSKLESAKHFKHWVTSEVLPSIRKTGRYSMKESNDGTANTVDKKLDEIMQQIQSIKAYLVTRDTAQVLVSKEMMKQ
jgi:prophage antirepressor-like protein